MLLSEIVQTPVFTVEQNSLQHQSEEIIEKNGNLFLEGNTGSP